MNLLCRDRLWRIEFWKGQRQQEREVSGQQSSLKGYRDTAETQKLVKSGGGGGDKGRGGGRGGDCTQFPPEVKLLTSVPDLSTQGLGDNLSDNLLRGHYATLLLIKLP